MPKIVLSDLAPSDAKHFSLANDSFDVPFETDDVSVIANATAHPWLKVELPKTKVKESAPIDRQVAPEDDQQSASFKGKRDTSSAADAGPANVVAIDAGLNQKKSVEEDGVSQTLKAAADEVPAAPATKDAN